MCAYLQVCICVHSSSAALCNRGRKSQDDGDFKTGLQLLRKPEHCMFFSSGLSHCSPLRLSGLNKSNFGKQIIEGGPKNTRRPMCQYRADLCKQQIWQDRSKWRSGNGQPSGETRCVRRDWSAEAAPPQSLAGSGAVAESARRKEGIEVGVETQLLLTAATDKLQKVHTWAS